MKILVINGPNLNMLEQRKPSIYGRLTLSEINKELEKIAGSLGISLIFFQSNHEGQLIDFIQSHFQSADGILLNPGALTHYGYSLRDCLKDCMLPVAEVHLSDLNSREGFRKVDVLDGVVKLKISALKEKSYYLGLKKLVSLIKRQK